MLIVAVSSLAAIAVAGPVWAAAVKSVVWAGYQAEGQSFRSVSATWALGKATCSGVTSRGDADSYSWVGLGSGAESERVVVREFCTGTLVAYATYLVMNNLNEVQDVHPAAGDIITAKVSYAAGKYHFALTDTTQGKSFALAYPCAAFSQHVGICSRSTAQVGAGIWSAGMSPLTDYGSDGFRDVAIVDAKGHHGALAENRFWRVSRFNEYDGSTRAASSSSLSQHGTSFTDTWQAP